MKNMAFGFSLAGSILGLLGSFIWLFLGTSIWAGFFYGLSGSYNVSDAQMGGGFILSLLQSAITTTGFIIALIKGLPKNIEVNPRKNGLWILWCAIAIGIVNLSLFIPCILLGVAAVVAINGGKNKVKYENE